MAEIERDVYVIGYGRFNPPTKGHQFAIFNKIIPLANKIGGRGIILTTRTFNKEKNPLKLIDKKRFIKASSSDQFKIVNDKEWIDESSRFCISDVRDIIVALTDLGQAKRVVILLGEDEYKALKPRIELYNHRQYEIELLEFVHAGSRTDASEIGSISATKMRQAAKDGDYATFEAMCSTKMSDSFKKEMFDAVRQGMGVN